MVCTALFTETYGAVCPEVFCGRLIHCQALISHQQTFSCLQNLKLEGCLFESLEEMQKPLEQVIRIHGMLRKMECYWSNINEGGYSFKGHNV